MDANGLPSQATLVALKGKVVAGVMEKWTNYAKGWQPRLFVLDGGVLRYYPVYGPDRATIAMVRAEHPDMVTIGEEILRVERKEQGKGASTAQVRPLGLVHMSVSSLRPSSAEADKFYIHSGTKTMNIRAGSQSDRAKWMDTLAAGKDVTQRQANFFTSESSDSIIDNVRQILVKGNTPDDVVQACVQQLVAHQKIHNSVLESERAQKQALLDKLSLLEEEKRALEAEVVTELEEVAQARGEVDTGIVRMSSSLSYANLQEEDDNEFFDADEEVAFAAEEVLQKRLAEEPAAVEAPLAGAVKNSVTEKADEPAAAEAMPSAAATPADAMVVAAAPASSSGGFKRRTHMPVPAEKERSVSLWAIIKENIGKDLNRVCLPVYFNEPTSLLQKACEESEYGFLIDAAAQKPKGSWERMLYVAAFSVSGYAATDKRTSKPFNPLLGETYEHYRPEEGVRIITEKVSHHPNILAIWGESTRLGWTMHAETTIKSKFWGRSIDIIPVGEMVLTFADGEVIRWEKVTSSVHNLIIGKLYIDHRGVATLNSNTGKVQAKIKFKESSMMEKVNHQVRGHVADSSGKKMATLYGRWSESLYYVVGDKDIATGGKLIWKKNPAAPNPTRYNMSSYAITLNEVDDEVKNKRVAPTDSRLRPDQRLLEEGHYDRANEEKLRLEDKQRKARKMQETGGVHKPRWFKPAGPEHGTINKFVYAGGYWEAKEKGDFEGCKDIFG